jgi:hypothetical protein
MNTPVCIIKRWTYQFALWSDEHTSLHYEEMNTPDALLSDEHTSLYHEEMKKTVYIMKCWKNQFEL